MNDIITVGCKVSVKKDKTILRAEVLSLKKTTSISSVYVHYDGYNKRLDEWVYIVFEENNNQLKTST